MSPGEHPEQDALREVADALKKTQERLDDATNAIVLFTESLEELIKDHVEDHLNSISESVGVIAEDFDTQNAYISHEDFRDKVATALEQIESRLEHPQHEACRAIAGIKERPKAESKVPRLRITIDLCVSAASCWTRPDLRFHHRLVARISCRSTSHFLRTYKSVKRDMDLARSIMLHVQSNLEAPRPLVIGPEDFECVDQWQLREHIVLLGEAGLLETKPSLSAHVIVIRMTWHGHDWIDSISKDTHWNRIKSIATEQMIPLTLNSIRAIAEQVLASAISKQ